eukprot:CAMPEP_0196660450 /NCGR_PEP_ID=MMETSP1086-20130531/39847_1 /TAXON_ID=77921 /ORGANISM="Cyanoptyche  gloeocystis , Strain SAG4.97" /LENGTH=269 /DNA_ID=CAMNT_0041994877 /DNA_START=66 /DNA_END=872 /DNA_ORIENTATION=+
MKLTEDVAKSMAMAKVFKDNTAKITHIDIFKAGDQAGSSLITASDDETFHLYNMNSGILTKTIRSGKYGCGVTKFTHSPSCVIMASKKNDESLRYLSLHDNRYLRYFKGHKDKVVSLAMSPANDIFISGAIDDTVRLWDLRAPECLGQLTVSGRPCVSFDPQGLVFSTAISQNTIKLYDMRSFDKGPFDTFKVDHKNVEWTGMKFSNDGKYILLSTSESVVILIDAFNGTKTQTYSGFLNDNGSVLEASFSPDCQFVLSGSEDGTIHVW